MYITFLKKALRGFDFRMSNPVMAANGSYYAPAEWSRCSCPIEMSFFPTSVAKKSASRRKIFLTRNINGLYTVVSKLAQDEDLEDQASSHPTQWKDHIKANVNEAGWQNYAKLSPLFANLCDVPGCFCQIDSCQKNAEDCLERGWCRRETRKPDARFNRFSIEYTQRRR